MHIQKTAGTSVQRLLSEVYGHEAVFPGIEQSLRQDPRGALNRYTNVSALLRDPDLPRYRAIVGHFPYATAQMLPMPVVTATVLRHPVSRTVSTLDHLRRDALYPKRRPLTLEELYEDPVINTLLVRDFQTRMLGLAPEQVSAAGAELPVESIVGDALGKPRPRKAVGAVRRSVAHMNFASPAMLEYPQASDEITARAQEALDEIDIVGVKGSLHQFAGACARKFDWPPADLPHANANPRKVRVSRRFARRIVRDNARDMRLYHRALARQRAGASGG